MKSIKRGLLVTATAILLATTATGMPEVQASGTSVVAQSLAKTAETIQKVDLRQTPNSKGKVFASVPEGTVLKILSSSKGWQKVSYNGKTGWVGAHYLKAVSTLVEAENKIDLRATANSKGKIVLSLPKGTQVEVIAQNGNWQKVTYNGTSGWVGAHHLVKAGATPKVVEAKNKIDLRATANSKAKVLASLPKGAKVEVVAQTGNWRKVTANGKTGWVGVHHLVEAGETVAPKPPTPAPTPTPPAKPNPTPPTTNPAPAPQYPVGKRLNHTEASSYLGQSMKNNPEFNSYDLMLDGELAVTIGFDNNTSVNASMGIWIPVYSANRAKMDATFYKYAETQTGIGTSYSKAFSEDIKTFITTKGVGTIETKTYGSQEYQFWYMDKFVRIGRLQ